jgi:hypothetical protein
MSMLNIAKKLKRLQKSKLTEAKADTQRLIDFAGQDLADRFLKIKDKLKSPENDLYYWIKNKTAADLELAVANIENNKSNSAAKKEISERGAQLVCDSAHWKVYHITTFEAAQKYGRDSQWCITGIRSYGDRYWKQYTDDGVSFYFAITKEDYDPRGTNSKFAFAVYPGGDTIELYNQVDDRVSLGDMPYYSEIIIPGVDLDNVAEEENEFSCENCGIALSEDEYYITPDGECYCEECFFNNYAYCEDCGDAFYLDDMAQSVTGDWYCETCWDKHLETDEGEAESIIFMADDEDYFEGDTPEWVRRALEPTLKAWNSLKAQGRLRFSQSEIEDMEKGVVASAKKAGVELGPEDFGGSIRNYENLDNPDDTGYMISVDGSSKRAENHSINVEQALEEILAFINSLSEEEKPNVGLAWRCASTGYDPDKEYFMDGYEGELIVSIFSDAEQEDGLWDSEEERIQEKTGSSYEEAEDKIRAALGLPKKVYESLNHKKRINESLSVVDEFRLYEKLWG